MKRKFRMVMSFLGKLKDNNIRITWPMNNGEVEWMYPSLHNNKLPQNVMDAITNIVLSKTKEILELDCYSDTEYYVLIVDIYAKEKKIEIAMEAEYETTEIDNYVTTITLPELKDFFEREGVKTIKAEYSGSGDSGDIEDVYIDGVVDRDITWGTTIPDKKLILDLLYEYLERAYGGWEIDDGSSGNIIINNNMQIKIDHEWNLRDMELCEGIIEIREEDLEE
jgi:hypothetical protein